MIPTPDVKLSDPSGYISKFWWDFLSKTSHSFGLTGEVSTQTAAYTLLASDAGDTIALGGSAYYVLTVGPASGFNSDFMCLIANTDTARGKRLTIDGITSFLLWPGQSVILVNTGSAWIIHPNFQRWQNSSFTVYVNSSLGNDNNDGQATGSGALQTISAAQSLIRQYIDTNGGPPTIKLDASLDYPVSSGLNFTYEGVVGSSQIYLTGDTGVSITCSAGGTCLSVQDRCIITVSNLTLKTSGNGSTAIFVRQLAVCDLIGVNFDAFTAGLHVSVSTLATCNFLGNYSITGGTSAHITAATYSYVNYGSFTCTVSGGLTITNFAIATNFGVINNGGVNMTFAGAGAGAGTTGTTYIITNGGIINHSGAFPGNVAGTAPTSLAAYGVKS
jgi:hypothetical protein